MHISKHLNARVRDIAEYLWTLQTFLEQNSALPCRSKPSAMQGKVVFLVALLAAVCALSQGSALHAKTPRQVPEIYKKLANLPRPVIAQKLRELIHPIFRSALDDQIIAMLESLKEKMKAPIPEYGLPTLDPFVLEHLDLDLNEAALQLKGTLDNLNVSGLSTFEVDQIKLNILLLSLGFGFTLPGVVLGGQYDVDGVAGGLIPIYGAGAFDINVKNFSITGSVKLGSNNSYIYIKALTLDFTVPDIKVNLEGLLGGGDLGDVMNEIINDLLPTLLTDNKDTLASTISDMLITLANEQLDGVTLQDILDLINGKKSLRK